MNAIAPVKFDPSVPAYLQRPEFRRITQQAAAGINNFQAPNRISIRASRFHLVDSEGVETDSTENNGVALDVIVVDANATISKLYYEGAYNPQATEPVAPTCFSDNGIGPSDRSATPQSSTCALCPHGVWGSKVTPQGSKVKACADIKKIAVVLASNPTGVVYGLNIPAASLKGWGLIVGELEQRGVDIGALVIRFEFDTTASYPKLKVRPLAWLSESQAQAVAPLVGSEETQTIVGATDKPIAALPGASGQQYRAEPVEQPQVVRPVGQAPTPPLPDMPAHTQAALAEGAKRTRRTKAEMEAARAQQPQQQAAAPAPQPDALDIPGFLDKRTPPPAAAPVVQPASADLDAMLDGIMGKK